MKHSVLCCVLLVLSAAAVRAAPVCVSEGWWGKLHRVEDVNGDGDALDAGEVTLWADGGSMANFTFLTADDTAI